MLRKPKRMSEEASQGKGRANAAEHGEGFEAKELFTLVSRLIFIASRCRICGYNGLANAAVITYGKLTFDFDQSLNQAALFFQMCYLS